ncbi:MAG: DUF1801 domain-containing protein [Bacteroidales bacterium]|nr:DUF1801 domain-containing protein [Bacteroidales bacterium]
MKNKKVPETIDEYISSFPPEIQSLLLKIRKAIRKAAPEAEEKISYQMPVYKFKGVVAYFAAHSNHIGFYPGPGAIIAFKEELSDYYTSKGTIHFPYDKPLPLRLISQIVKFNYIRNLEKDKLKKGRKKYESS